MLGIDVTQHSLEILKNVGLLSVDKISKKVTLLLFHLWGYSQEMMWFVLGFNHQRRLLLDYL